MRFALSDKTDQKIVDLKSDTEQNNSVILTTDESKYDSSAEKLIFLSTWNNDGVKNAISRYPNENVEVIYKDVRFSSLGLELEMAQESTDRYIVIGLTEFELDKYRKYLQDSDDETRKLIVETLNNIDTRFARLASPTVCYNTKNIRRFLYRDVVSVKELLQEKKQTGDINENLESGERSTCYRVATGMYSAAYSTAYDSIKNSVNSPVNAITIGDASSPGWLYPVNIKTAGYRSDDELTSDFTSWWVSKEMPGLVDSIVNTEVEK